MVSLEGTAELLRKSGVSLWGIKIYGRCPGGRARTLRSIFWGDLKNFKISWKLRNKLRLT